MAGTEIKVQMQQRRDTASGWTNANPTLLNGELGYETDTSKWKIGNGVTAWTSLGYTAWSQISYPIATADIADDAVTSAKLADTISISGDLTVGDDLLVMNTGTFLSSVTITGGLTVLGDNTKLWTTNLEVIDNNIEIGSVSTPTDVTADGGGITLKGATDKTINWVDATDAWTLSEHVNIASTKEYRIAGVKVLDATSLGSALLTDSTASTSTTTAATPNSVKTSYDLAGAALPKAGGTMTGDIVFNSGQAIVGYTPRTSATGSSNLSVGTTAQRDGSPAAGMIRYNSTLGQFEGYGSAWGAIGGGGGATGGGSDEWAVEHDNTITTSYAIGSGKNVISAGPLTVNSGAIVTVPSGSTWVIA